MRNGSRAKREEWASTGSLGEQVLAHAQSGREVVQDFVPLAESLEWTLGQEYLRQRGNKAFLSDAMPVPFVVNNDGTLSRNAAEVFFQSLLVAEKDGTLDGDIQVLELGIGVGLFARYFLDRMRELSVQHKKDFYERLTYIAADRSERMLGDALRHGVFAEHPGRVVVRRVDALEAEKLEIRSSKSETNSKSEIANSKQIRLRAVFLNYLLDCLPAAVLEFGGESVKQLHVRTCVARSVRLADYTDLTAEQLRERAKSVDPRARDELLEVYGLFASEYDYRPVDPHLLPHGDFAVEFGRKRAKRLLHSYGAIQCLDKLLGMLAPGGFILFNDYGPTTLGLDDEFEHQRFSLATFVGVNFAQLKAYYGAKKVSGPFSAPLTGEDGARRDGAEKGPDTFLLEPAGEEGRGIHARLLAPAVAYEVGLCFRERFGQETYRRLQEPIEKARAYAKQRRDDLALSCYREAERVQPWNWVLYCEMSRFLTFGYGKPDDGADMAKLALRLNPTCSSEAWNALGDALFAWGRYEEARSAYEQALAVNESDVPARYNLAWVHTQLKDYPAALGRIAEALALDKTGSLREGLLKKQEEVLALQTRRHQREYLLLINLVSKSAQPEGANTGVAR